METAAGKLISDLHMLVGYLHLLAWLVGGKGEFGNGCECEVRYATADAEQISMYSARGRFINGLAHTDTTFQCEKQTKSMFRKKTLHHRYDREAAPNPTDRLNLNERHSAEKKKISSIYPTSRTPPRIYARGSTEYHAHTSADTNLRAKEEAKKLGPLKPAIQ